jgi:hypothetical protein
VKIATPTVGRNSISDGACNSSGSMVADGGACNAVAPDSRPFWETRVHPFEGPPQPGPYSSPRPTWVRVRITGPRENIALLRDTLSAIKKASDWTLDDGECLRLMLLHFADVHASPAILKLSAKHRAMSRDRWICQMPNCRKMSGLNEHHRVFRSAGGSDDPSNLVTVCHRCHDLVHEGYVAISGDAPDGLVFHVGLTPGRDAVTETYAQEVRVRLAT